MEQVLNRLSPIKQLHKWLYIRARRVVYALHSMATDHPIAGPASFLAVSAAMGLALTLTTLYSSGYAVLVDGENIGVVSDRKVVTEAIQRVEQHGTRLLGSEYTVPGEVDYEFALTLKHQLNNRTDIENHFYQHLNEVSADLRKYQVVVNGTPVGIVESEDQLNSLFKELKGNFSNENTIFADFADSVQVEYVYGDVELMDINRMREILTANKVGQTTYTIAWGDTFNGIAYENDMSVSDLQQLNPDVNINRLMIGDVLKVKEEIPLVSVTTRENAAYYEDVECPIIEVQDPTLYVGDSKVKVQGTPGRALVNATITYVNGVETGREVTHRSIVWEPTPTTMAVGTKPKPRTASTGTYKWPITGRVTSYFGGRYIFGGYSYHSGIDINASHGAPIYAADGGTVTFSGWKGTYGKLVIITHDNGTKTYYAHNSSLTVSVGDKVYQGQQIAKAGSTGRSTGTHCHFEIRIDGTSVNPLSYLQ